MTGLLRNSLLAFLSSSTTSSLVASSSASSSVAAFTLRSTNPSFLFTTTTTTTAAAAGRTTSRGFVVSRSNTTVSPIMSAASSSEDSGVVPPPPPPPAVPKKRYLLHYDYVPDVLEKRGPYRAGHLELAQKMVSCLSGGPVGESGASSPSGALFVFSDAESAQAFVKGDPYVEHGIVTGWRVQEWTVAVEK